MLPCPRVSHRTRPGWVAACVRSSAGSLRATGVLVVYGSGFGCDPAAGTFRVVFLPKPEELSRIYDDIAEFTGRYLATA